MGRVKKWSSELVGRICSKGSVVDGTGEELTELEAPPGCGGVQEPGTDALAYMSEGTLREDTACHSARAEHAHFASRPGQDVVEGCSGILDKPAAGGRTGTLGRRPLRRPVWAPVLSSGTTWWKGR